MKPETVLAPNESATLSLPENIEFPAEGKNTRVLFTAPSGKVVLVTLASGHEWQEHATPNHALVQVLSGQCEFWLEGRPLNLEQGDLLHLAPDVAHSVKAMGQLALLLSLFKPS